ncbi:hypothetical protein HDU96_005688 [Phlyctochytrium bullatum]|nr:hypothetical protein HDU96_005688 [Phlyctochytrium bullatum]
MSSSSSVDDEDSPMAIDAKDSPKSKDESTSPWNRLLPYDTLAHQDAYLASILSSLQLAMRSRDISGCLVVSKNINAFISLKYHMPIETRTFLVKAFYHLATIEGMNAVLANNYASTCVKLMRKKELFPDGSIELPWRPLYNILRRTFFPRGSERVLPADVNNSGGISSLTVEASRFFPPTSTLDILEELLPDINPHNIPHLFKILGCLSLLLPLRTPPPPLPSQPPTTPHKFYWVPTLFALWSLVGALPKFTSLFLDVFARLAWHQTATPANASWSRAQVRFVFTSGLALLELPVSGDAGSQLDGAQAGRAGGLSFPPVDELAGRSRSMQALATFVVYTLFPEGAEGAPDTGTMGELKAMVQAIEGAFVEGVEFGVFAEVAKRFVFGLLNPTHAFLWFTEEKDSCKTPKHLRLTPEIRREFVQLLRNVAYLAMFSKDRMLVQVAAGSIRNLALLEPELMIPGLLDRIYPALENLTETHRTSSSISVLSTLAQVLVSRRLYPEGAAHVLPLLSLTLPGIDPNDAEKTSITALFLTHVLMMVPVRDVSGVPAGPNDTEADDAVRLSTAEFESWALAFLERVLAFLENLPQNHGMPGTKAGGMESTVMNVLLQLCSILYIQSSPPIQHALLRRIHRFTSTRVIPSATKAVGRLVRTFLGTITPAKLALFIPSTASRIHEELAAGASAHPSPRSTAHPFGIASLADAGLHWHQSVLMNCVVYAGEGLVKYKECLREVAWEAVERCRSFRGVRWAAKLVRYLVGSLVAPFPEDFTSFNSEQWEDEEFMNRSYRHWGEHQSLHTLTFKWHTPTRACLDFALELLTLFIPHCDVKLREILADPDAYATSDRKRATSLEVCRWTSVLRSALQGAAAVVGPEPGEGEDVAAAAFGYNVKPWPLPGAGYLPPDHELYPKFKELRDLGGKVLADTLEFVRVKGEDDVAGLKDLVKAGMMFVANRGVEGWKLGEFLNSYRFVKTLTSAVESGKRLPRFLLMQRVYTAHLNRYRLTTSHAPLTPLTEHFTLTFAKLVTSRYVDVRRAALDALGKVIAPYPRLKAKVFHGLLEELKREPLEEHVAEGAFWGVKKKTFMENFALREWGSAAALMEMLGRPLLEVKPQILETKRSIFLNVMTQYCDLDPGIEYDTWPEGFVGVGASDVEHYLPAAQQYIAAKNADKLKTYTGLLDYLLSHVSATGLHWRSMAMSVNLIELIMREETPVSRAAAEFAVTCLVSEHPTARTVGLSFLKRLLVVLKRRAKRVGVARTAALKRVVVREGVRELETGEVVRRAVEAVEGDVEDLHDTNIVGWLCWPKQIKLYRTAPDTFDTATTDTFNLEDLPYYDPTSADALRCILDAVSAPTFWTSAVGFFSIEATRAHESFNFSVFTLTRLLFAQFEDRFLDAFVAAVEPLLLDFADKSRQKAACELVAGLVRATKHWTGAKRRRVWEWIGPVLPRIFQGITVETMGYWGDFVTFVCASRDVRRVRPLLDAVLNWKPDPTSQNFFNESKKLLMHRIFINVFNWRLSGLSVPLLKEFMGLMCSPFKQVRSAIGATLDDAIQAKWFVGAATVEELLVRDLAEEGDPVSKGLVPRRFDAEVDEIYAEAFRKLQELRVEAEASKVVGGTSDYGSACKTLISAYCNSMVKPGNRLVFAHVEHIWSEIFHMVASDDLDLQRVAGGAAALYPSQLHPPSFVPAAADRILGILTDADEKHPWHVKARMLPLLQVFYFRHLHMIPAELDVRVVEVVASVMEDRQIEVRQMAATTLSGLIRCSQREAIQALKLKFEATLKETKAAKKRVTLPPRAPSSPNLSANGATGSTSSLTGAPSVSTHPLLVKRHGAVLGLSALVLAFPYEVPSWMPDVLVTLASCGADLAPVSTTVSKTFAEFKRTHQDTWREDMLMFTEDQKEILSDLLIGASYYA